MTTRNAYIKNRNFIHSFIYGFFFVFRPQFLFCLAKDVDLEYATKDTFQTDTAISRCNGSSFDMKELVPWSCEEPTGITNGELECLDDNANGWDPREMIKINETVFKVQSTFDPALTGYTVQIQKQDTQDFK